MTKKGNGGQKRSNQVTSIRTSEKSSEMQRAGKAKMTLVVKHCRVFSRVVACENSES